MKAWPNIITLTTAVAGLLTLLVVLPGAGFAQVDAAPAPASAADGPPQVLGMDFTSYIDIGYVNFTTGNGQLALATPSGETFAHSRTFDFQNGVVSIQNLDLKLDKAPENGFGGRIELTLGKDADTIAAYGTIDKDKGPAADAEHYYDITQLYGFYGVGSAANVIVGKFVTHHGEEVIRRIDDTNFSSSILFGFAIPFTHTGARITYKPADTLAILVGANEGWDTITDSNGGLTAELGGEWSPSKVFSLMGTLMSGPQRVFTYPQAAYDASETGTRNLIDLIAIYNASDSLNFVLNYDSGSQDKAPLLNGNTGIASWSGFALYANYRINDSWRVSARTESFNDSDGYRTTVEPGKTKGPTWNEGTFTVAYMGIEKLELRGEVRSDNADQKIFMNKDGDKAIDSQTSIGLEAIYKFF